MGRQLVKAADLGYISKNLERIPSKEEEKEQLMKQALYNLTKTEQPERLSRVSLPDSLLNLLE